MTDGITTFAVTPDPFSSRAQSANQVHESGLRNAVGGEFRRGLDCPIGTRRRQYGRCRVRSFPAARLERRGTRSASSRSSSDPTYLRRFRPRGDPPANAPSTWIRAPTSPASAAMFRHASPFERSAAMWRNRVSFSFQDRATPITSWPSDRNCSTTADPSPPLAPVMRIRMVLRIADTPRWDGHRAILASQTLNG